MVTTQKPRAHTQRKSGNFGLLANGSSGPWEVAIDEATSGSNRWWAQIDGPSVSFCFEIPSLDIVSKMARFLDSRPNVMKPQSDGLSKRSNSLVLGKDKKSSISLVKDDEYDDRFFLVFGAPDSPIVRFAIAGTDAVKIVEALRQVEEDLVEAD